MSKRRKKPDSRGRPPEHRTNGPERPAREPQTIYRSVIIAAKKSGDVETAIAKSEP